MTTGQKEGEGEGSVGTPGSDGAQPMPMLQPEEASTGLPGETPKGKKSFRRSWGHRGHLAEAGKWLVFT